MGGQWLAGAGGITLRPTEGAQVFSEGLSRWAKEVQGLALLCVGIATGRRRSGLRNLKVQWIDFKRDELRYEREKGKPGRVLPVAPWAMTINRPLGSPSSQWASSAATR